MVKTNELRIGNNVYCPVSKKNGKIVAIEIGNRPIVDVGVNKPYTESYSGVDCLEGIIITKKIVSEITPNLLDWFIEGSYILVPDEEYGWCLKVRNANHFKEIEFGYFKYLHQLQNIYYILSQGVELEWTGSSIS